MTHIIKTSTVVYLIQLYLASSVCLRCHRSLIPLFLLHQKYEIHSRINIFLPLHQKENIKCFFLRYTGGNWALKPDNWSFDPHNGSLVDELLNLSHYIGSPCQMNSIEWHREVIWCLHTGPVWYDWGTRDGETTQNTNQHPSQERGQFLPRVLGYSVKVHAWRWDNSRTA